MKTMLKAFRSSKVKMLLYLVIGYYTFNSCIRDDDFSIPPIDCTGLISTLNINDLIQIVDDSKEENKLVIFSNDAVLEGYVNTSDETGNFYKTFSIQDDPVNPSIKGIQVEVDASSLYTFYPEGSKVQIQLNGLVAGYDRGVVKIGSTYIQNNEVRVGRMSNSLANSNIKKTCDGVEAITPRIFNSLKEALKPQNVNTLVSIKNVQFQSPDIDLTFGDAIGLTTVNRKVIDKKGTAVDLRNSGYATWAGNTLPSGSGEITAIVSLYNSTYQLYIRDVVDVRFSDERFVPGQPEQPSNNALSLFKGADFNNWNQFLESKNSSAYDNMVKEGNMMGLDSSVGLHLFGRRAQNGAVFTTRATADQLPKNPTKIHFWIKGKSEKSLNIYLYKTTLNARGQQTNYAFNVKDLNQNKLVLENNGGSNSYVGKIDTNGKWVYVELNIESLNDINFYNDKLNLIAFRVGSNADYDLVIDNITIE